jgi:uncharacterized Fe-S cluster-containing protein
LLRSFIEISTHKHFCNFREKAEFGEALKQKEAEIKELTSKSSALLKEKDDTISNKTREFTALQKEFNETKRYVKS